jgi:hypothetical protein
LSLLRSISNSTHQLVHDGKSGPDLSPWVAAVKRCGRWRVQVCDGGEAIMRRIWMTALAAVVSLPTLAAAQDLNRALGALTGRDAEQQQDQRNGVRNSQDELDRIREERAQIRNERREIARQRGVRFVDDDSSARGRDRSAGSSGSSSRDSGYRQIDDERAALDRDRRRLDDERRRLDSEGSRSNSRDTVGGKIDDMLGNRQR